MSAQHPRRHFIVTSSALAAGLWIPPTKKSSAAEGPLPTKAILRPTTDNLFRVRMEVSLEGLLQFPKDPLVSKQKDRELPLKATSVIDFEELLTRDGAQRPQGSRRYYYEARSEAEAKTDRQLLELRKEAKRLVSRRSGGAEIIYSENTFLDHNELALLQTPLSSFALDEILPREEVSVGSTYQPAPETLAQLLNLDAVQSSTVRGEVIALDSMTARVQWSGHLEASSDGVPTSLDLAAKMIFDRKSNAVTWLAVSIRENREIGLARPGFEVGATVKLLRQRLESPNATGDSAPLEIEDAPPKERLLVNLRSLPGRFTAFMDRQWHVINDQAGATTLRMIVNEKSLAQCDLRPLPNLKPGEQLTLEAFQAEIRRALGTQFGQFIESEEGLSGGQLRAMRVVVMGQSSTGEVPVQWVFLQFSDDTGRRLAATFIVPNEHVEAFGGSDAQLANSLAFLDPAGETTPAPAQASTATKPGATPKK